MVYRAQMPLPKAKKIIRAVVATWNRRKVRINEMTRFLDELDFIFRRGMPKQMLIMRKLRKEALTVYFAKKHCFPKKTKHGRVRVMPVGKGYSAIQAYL
jgi:hypothetical protein